MNKNESGKSTSIDKRMAHSGVTAHTFSSSLKQRGDKRNQQAVGDQKASLNEKLGPSSGSQERPLPH